MFEISLWEFTKNEENERIFNNFDEKSHLKVLKIFEFHPDLQRMSVIVFDIERKKTFLFCKGAPEKIKSLCKSSSVPTNFEKSLDVLTLKGNRVLGLGFREIDPNESFNDASQETLEQSINFLGFLIFENQLKKNSAETIEKLIDAGIKVKIISGDNPLTTMQTMRELSNINSQKANSVLCDFDFDRKKVKIKKFHSSESFNQSIHEEHYLNAIIDIGDGYKNTIRAKSEMRRGMLTDYQKIEYNYLERMKEIELANDAVSFI